MHKVTVIYSPQCPSNAHFVREIEDWSRSYGVSVESIDVFEEHERAQRLLENTPLGHLKHLFITVFIDGRWIPGHPGNPRFKGDFLRALEEEK